jgi:protein-tyrosine phosphatase
VLLRARLARHGIEAHVHSAGLLTDGQSASPLSVQVMTSRGLDLSTHRSRRMTRALLLDADLILGMAREHVREAAVFVPEVWPRAFTIKELVRRGEAVGPRQGEDLDAWLASVHEGRATRDLTGWSDDDDVADPIGEPHAVFERTAAELQDLTDRLVYLMWGSAPAGGEPEERQLRWA